jgi:mannose-6-phosphate isomerase-like protein (cupin superfamily)
MGGTPKSGEYLWTSERCFILEVLNSDQYPEVSIALTRVEPGMTTQQHALSVHEVYVIKEGAGTMFLGDKPPFEVGPGDVVTIPKGMPQSIRNNGTVDLVFTCVCAPRFSQNCYTSLE